jgi:hypothetical protein
MTPTHAHGLAPDRCGRGRGGIDTPCGAPVNTCYERNHFREGISDEVDYSGHRDGAGDLGGVAAENGDVIPEGMPKPAPKTKSNPRSQQPPATEKEKRDAFFAYFSCLDAAAREMDDGRSDASTIALGIKSLCASQFARTVELEGRSLNPAARRLFESKAQNSQLEMAAQAVLAGRANKRP